MRPWLVVQILVFSASQAFAQAPSSEVIVKFEDLPKLIRERNENVSAAQATVKARESRMGHLKRSFLPRVDLSVGGERFHAGIRNIGTQEFYKAEASLNLYRGGKDRLEEEARKSETQISKVALERELSNEIKDAKSTYWTLVAIDQLIVENKDAIEKNKANIASARRRIGAGIATNSDLIQFELHQTSLAQAAKKLDLERDLAAHKLAVALGLEVDSEIKLSSGFPHPPDVNPEEETVPLEAIPEVQAMKASEMSAQLLAKKESRWWAPTVDLYSYYGLPSLSDETTRALTEENEWAAGIRVGIALPEGLASRSETQSRLHELTALQKRAAYRAREIKASDREFRHDLKLLHELIHDADKDIERAASFLKLTQSEYTRGVKNGPDLLSAFQKAYEFRERRIQLYKEYHQTRAELIGLLGRNE